MICAAESNRPKMVNLWFHVIKNW